MGNPDDTHADGATDPQEVADEAFLFAIARAPSQYKAVTDSEEAAIAAWSRGRASPQEVEVARTAIRSNLAAKELMLSLRLEQAAAAAPSIPRRLSRAILRQTGPPRAWHLGGRLGLPSIRNWQFAGLGAVAVAAFVLMVFVRHSDGPDGVSFQVAALSDRSMLVEPGGTFTRGAPAPGPSSTPTVPVARPRDFTEIDVPVPLLRDLFVDGTRPWETKAVEVLVRDNHFLEKGVTLVFDREIEAIVKGGTTAKMITLRVYDLTVRANTVLAQDPGLASVLAAGAGPKAVFITMAP